MLFLSSELIEDKPIDLLVLAKENAETNVGVAVDLVSPAKPAFELESLKKLQSVIERPIESALKTEL